MYYRSKDRSNNLLLSFLRLHFSEVKFEFAAFEDVTVGSSALSGAAGDGSKKTTGQELFIDGSFQLGHTLTDLVFLFRLLRPLLVENSFFSFSLFKEKFLVACSKIIMIARIKVRSE